MPGLADHKSAASEFLSAYRGLPPDEIAPGVVMLYLCGLHIIELYAASEGIHNENHGQRRDFIQAHAPKLWKHYHTLYNAGADARYSPCDLGMSPDAVTQQLYRRHLRALILEVGNILDIDLAAELSVEPASPTQPPKKTKTGKVGPHRA